MSRAGETTDQDGLYRGMAGYKNHIKKSEAQVCGGYFFLCLGTELRHHYTGVQWTELWNFILDKVWEYGSLWLAVAFCA